MDVSYLPTALAWDFRFIKPSLMSRVNLTHLFCLKSQNKWLDEGSSPCPFIYSTLYGSETEMRNYYYYYFYLPRYRNRVIHDVLSQFDPQFDLDAIWSTYNNFCVLETSCFLQRNGVISLWRSEAEQNLPEVELNLSFDKLGFTK